MPEVGKTTEWTEFSDSPICPCCGDEVTDSVEDLGWTRGVQSMPIECGNCGASVIVETRTYAQYRAMKNPFAEKVSSHV